ncbi:hypothetical protein GXB85_05950 [Cellulomonas sp. APG4]|uniref:hypothetical protein n=1 Tax=Cellulomonas sp. APG4 TaxID=1538656 RepID=UPI00137B1503|nr:hypothetical protein [Cellulomonas sp. APG4]NCT90490.1 hypothetical protein [Cellulomonas sp. APG4]
MHKVSTARQVFALAARWILRGLAAYVVLALALLAGGLLVGPEPDWDRVGGVGSLLVAYAFWMVLFLPVLVVVGTVQAVVVWVAFLLSRGSRTVCGVAGGAGATLVSASVALVSSDPTGLDLAAYLAASVCVGALAGWMAARDARRLSAARSSQPPGVTRPAST